MWVSSCKPLVNRTKLAVRHTLKLWSSCSESFQSTQQDGETKTNKTELYTQTLADPRTIVLLHASESSLHCLHGSPWHGQDIGDVLCVLAQTSSVKFGYFNLHCQQFGNLTFPPKSVRLAVLHEEGKIIYF